ncbi:hypothetical protein KC717_04340 [Candidatus Dojkabacteria bacterium]|uniref:Uncharacterized protein n=1 Tax=Candidatus Dojkabacteria bacterium TaxID=2099670 RepID=A0A955L982_9BACT|nr:hypothetical protein [Candidatus Dojkabacteria bacterium]
MDKDNQQVNQNIRYLIDPQVIGYFLRKPYDSSEVAEYGFKYEDKVSEIQGEELRKFIQETESLAGEDLEKRFQEVINLPEGQERPLINPDYLNRVDAAVQNLNQQIYAYYLQHMSQEEKDELNVYIKQVEEAIKEEIRVSNEIHEQVLRELQEELERTGRIASNEEVEQQNSNQEEVAIENEEDNTNQQEVEGSHSEPDHDPVLESSDSNQGIDMAESQSENHIEVQSEESHHNVSPRDSISTPSGNTSDAESNNEDVDNIEVDPSLPHTPPRVDLTENPRN